MLKFYRYFLILFAVIFFSCSKNVLKNEGINFDELNYPFEFSMYHDGLKRQYTVYKPENLDDDAPIVFVLHGYTSNSKNIMNYSKMNEIAEKNKFLVCYPQGSINIYTSRTHWNANLKEMSSINDSNFISELVKKLQSDFNLNSKNIFACGMSNGGFMSYTLACEKSDIFRAIASVTGTMSGYDWNNCQDSKVPIFQLSGTADRVVPMDGSMSWSGGWGGAPEISKVIDFWSNKNECKEVEIYNIPDINKSDNSNVKFEKRKNCYKNKQVWFYTVYGGGHTWPGAWGNMDINTSQEIWNFFEKHLE